MKTAVALAIFAMVFAATTGPAASQTDEEDPFRWLEEVEGERAMEWVNEHNSATLRELSGRPEYQELYDRALAILDSEDRMAYPSILGDWLYNFWKDAENPRGVWRRTSWQSYLAGEPDWKVVLDVDALAEAEGVSWSYAGASCLPPHYRSCLVRLSRGGADAVEVREFDLQTLDFVANGFFLPEAKQNVSWVDEDAVLVATDFGEGSLTTSGYARIAKLWRRGVPLEQATTLFEGERTDVSVGVGSYRTADASYPIVYHRPSFFEGSVYVLSGAELVRLDLPLDADPSLVRDRLVVYLRSPWEVGGTVHPAGSLVSTSFDDFLAGGRAFELVYDPGMRGTVRDVGTTRDYLLVSVLENVRSRLLRFQYRQGRWTAEQVPTPDLTTVSLSSTSPFTNRFFFSSSGFTQPTTLYVTEEDGAIREVRGLPAMFDAEGLVVRQMEATSADGTVVPYFIVHHRDVELDGDNPTLLYAYGGFEVSYTPSYSAVMGALWLERGGVYVLANIRGGGEFGPRWHRAALKENRQRAYDDFLAVAENLIEHGATSPERLGIMGGSNGGLLMGVALTQRPDLFDAVVIQVPLLDMKRYNKLLAGASWMAEYGNPDIPAEWEYIRRYSPYQNVEADADYPKVLFTTTTRDDRVHPGHARKMAARMESMGHPVYYFENTEGGHGSGVTSEQQARTLAVTYTYLWERLGKGGS
jgi:prolyl oligopeptidase